MFFYTFLPKLLNMSLTAGVAVLFVLLLRLLLRRAPKAVSYALWAVVLFRLLCPVAPSSGLSLFNLLDAPAAQAGGMASSIEYVPEDIVHTAYPEVALPVPGISETVNGALPQGEEQLRADPLEAPMAIATCAWMAGVAAMVLYSAASYIRLKRRLLASMSLLDNIYLADEIASPFVLGLLRPKIYLPSSLAEREREYIILHERHHIRRLDHIIKALAFLALCIHWFNPLVWLAFVFAGKDMEMSCDEAVIRKLGAGVRADYSASLLSLATGKRVIAGMPLAFGEGDAKGRIKNLANWKKPAFWVVLLAVLACIALAAGLLTNPAAEESGGDEAGYYLRVGAEGVMQIELSMPDSSGGVIHADGSPFALGEEVWLEMLDGVYDLRGLRITATDGEGKLLYALSIPEGATDTEIADIVGGGSWLLAPAGTLGADPLHYKSAAAAAAAVEEMTAIYCPDAEIGADGLIQIGAASGAELAKYLRQWDWKLCAAPRHALPSPGSVEFVIAEDYRVTVHQRKEGSLRRYGEVEYRGETRYYSIGRSDYPDAVALVYAQNAAAAAAPAVQEWFNYLDSPADMPWEESLEIEIPAFPDLTFRWYPGRIEAGNRSAVKTVLTGMPIWNAYFADLSGDGLPEICATATFGSGVIDSRILVHDYIAGESYVLEDRGEYDYALHMEDGRLLAVQSGYHGEPIASGALVLEELPDGTKELRAELRPLEAAPAKAPRTEPAAVAEAFLKAYFDKMCARESDLGWDAETGTWLDGLLAYDGKNRNGIQLLSQWIAHKDMLADFGYRIEADCGRFNSLELRETIEAEAAGAMGRSILRGYFRTTAFGSFVELGMVRDADGNYAIVSVDFPDWKEYNNFCESFRAFMEEGGHTDYGKILYVRAEREKRLEALLDMAGIRPEEYLGHTLADIDGSGTRRYVIACALGHEGGFLGGNLPITVMGMDMDGENRHTLCTLQGWTGYEARLLSLPTPGGGPDTLCLSQWLGGTMEQYRIGVLQRDADGRWRDSFALHGLGLDYSVELISGREARLRYRLPNGQETQLMLDPSIGFENAVAMGQIREDGTITQSGRTKEPEAYSYCFSEDFTYKLYWEDGVLCLEARQYIGGFHKLDCLGYLYSLWRCEGGQWTPSARVEAGIAQSEMPATEEARQATEQTTEQNSLNKDAEAFPVRYYAKENIP